MKALVNGKIILEDGIYNNMVLLMEDKITGILPIDSFEEGDAVEVIDVAGDYISPGFIDIHIHGSGGKDTMDGSLEALEVISSTVMQYGTTGFLPTTMTMEMKAIHNALNTIRLACETGMQGAKVLGAHLEGPFINREFKGAQNENYIVRPEYSYIKDYLDIIKIITMAPEVEGGRDFIEAVKGASTATLSIGHSAATYDETMEAIEAGLSHCTHIFNAMSPLNHRMPGVVGAVLSSEISCELIADNIHVHPAIFKLLFKLVGDERLVLVTDAIPAGCMKDGNYSLGGQEIKVFDGRAQLENGSLAGSVITLNKAVINFLEATGAPLHQVIKLVSLNPARVIGLQNRKGSLAVGKDADVIVFDEKIDVNMVFIEGQKRLGG